MDGLPSDLVELRLVSGITVWVRARDIKEVGTRYVAFNSTYPLLVNNTTELKEKIPEALNTLKGDFDHG